MGKHGYLVQTTMGKTLMDSSSQVYVQVNFKKYLEKSVRDLKPGDLVVYSKPFTKTTLADVEPFLHKSPRYAKSRDLLHEKNSNDRYTPKLRTLLARGLANKGIINSEDLEAKVIFEGDKDFSRQEYDVMNNHVYNSLVIDGEPQIGNMGINGWLVGNVIAPRNWQIFKLLTKEINPAFEIFKDGDDKPDSMYFNYRLYVAIRQGVMRFLNQAKGLPGEEGWKEAENKISLSPEYALVFNHFLKDINMNYAAARVTKVENVHGRFQIDGLKRDELIEQGVVKSSTLNLPRKNYQEVFEEQSILENYLRSALEDFDCGPIKIDGKQKHLTRYQRSILGIHTLCTLFEHYGEELDPYTKYLKTVLTDVTLIPGIKDIREYAHKIKEDLLMGEIDKSLGFERGTIMQLLESDFRICTAIPNRIHDFVAFIKGNFHKEIYKFKNGYVVEKPSEIHKEEIRQRDKIKKMYDLEFNELGEVAQSVFFSNTRPVLDEIDDTYDRRTLDGMIPSELLNFLIIDKNKFGELTKKVKSSLPPNACLHTKESLLKILDQYNLAHIINLRKHDFYWEDFE